MDKIVGIDLGTTFSAIAIMEAGRAKIIPNTEGRNITPSVVTIKNNEVIVGEVAKRQAVVNPRNTVRSIKRLMGTRETMDIDNKKYTPEQISAFILQKLKRDAEAYLNEPIKKAVITVPAYFEDSQRQATKDAGVIAGLDVLRIVNEPTAAALAYGLNKTNEHTIMVYDLGGGTFDVSILELGDGVFEVKATAGNNHLGGDDFDDRVVDYIANEFKSEYGIDLREDRIALQRLKEAAEKAKIELSTLLETTISLPFVTSDKNGPKHLEIKLTRAKFEELISDLLKKTEGPVRQAMKDAKITPQNLNKVILVGGSTRIPAVQGLVKELTDKEPDKSVHPDEAVALGAAIQAGILGGEVKDILLLDVTSLSLGIETLGGICTKIIPRNTTIPTRRSQIFTTAGDSQTAVTIHVLQGEREMADSCISLGKFDLVGIPPAPRGIPQIEVTFDVDANGIVNVAAKDLATSKEQKIIVTGSTRLAKNKVEDMVKEAEKYAEDDKKKRDEIEVKNNAEGLLYASEKIIKEFEGKIDVDTKSRIEEKLNELKSAINENKDIKKKMEELEKVLQEIGTKMYGQHQSEQPFKDEKSDTVDAEVVDDDKKDDEEVK